MRMVRSAPNDTASEPAQQSDGHADRGLERGPAAAPSRPEPGSHGHPVGPAGRRRMANTLFAAGGALAAYPGPAAVIGPGDLVLAANDAAEPLLHALSSKRSGELRIAIESALGSAWAGAPAQLQPLLLPMGGGEQTALELLVLPFADIDAALLLGRDVTLERTLRAALVESRQRYKDLVEASSDFVWETGPSGCFVFVSPGGALGYRADELVGRHPSEFLIDGEATDGAFPFDARMPASKVELWFRTAGGEPASLVAAARPLTGEDGLWKGTRGICQDVSETRRREAELGRYRHRERLLAYLVRTIRYEVDPRNAASAAATAALPALAAEGCRVHRCDDDGGFVLTTECGAAAPESEAEALAALIAGESRFERATDAHAVIAVPIRQGRRLSGALLLWRPIGLGAWDEDDLFLVAELAEQLGVALQQIASQDTLATLSRTDPLTGLVNRRSFVGELEQRLATRRRGALLYLDLDNFKPVNDRLGHASGDAVLVTVARLLREGTRASDLIGRLGGDEFVVWLEDIDEPAAMVKARDLLRRFARDLAPLSADLELPLGASIGIALSSGADREDADALIARSDGSMYSAKRAGKQHFVIAAPPAPAEGAAP